MKRTSSRKTKKDRESAALRAALTRKDKESHKAVYTLLSEGRNRHLKGCLKPRCVECKDAKVLIRYYRKQMRKPPRLVVL